MTSQQINSDIDRMKDECVAIFAEFHKIEFADAKKILRHHWKAEQQKLQTPDKKYISKVKTVALISFTFGCFALLAWLWERAI